MGEALVKVSVKELVNGLDFSAESIVASLLNQGKLLLKASYYRVEKMRARMQAEAAVDKTKLEVATEVRLRDDVKVTVQFVTEQVEGDERVLEAKAKYDEAKALEEWAKLLLNSYEMRAQMLKAMVQLIGAEAAQESAWVRSQFEALGMQSLKEKVRTRFPGKKDGGT